MWRPTRVIQSTVCILRKSHDTFHTDWSQRQTKGDSSIFKEWWLLMTNLPLSRPTPQTRILAIGWEWRTLRSMGSTRFNILFSNSRYMSFPWKKNESTTLISCSSRHRKESDLYKTRWFSFVFYTCLCACTVWNCVYVRVLWRALNKWSNPKKRGWRMKGYWKRDEALSMFCRFTLNWTAAQRRKGFQTLLYFPPFHCFFLSLTYISEDGYPCSAFTL